MPPLTTDPDALLCERCGYAIAGLSEQHPCPECGQPAGQSWPKHRPGTLYQTMPRFRGRWFSGNIEVLKSPSRLFRRLRIAHSTSSKLLHTNLLLTAALLTWGWMGVHEEWLIVTPFIWLCTYAMLLLLTFIETLGLRFFGRAESRKWRITSEVAWSVCDHASIGWLAGGVAMLLVLAFNPADALSTWNWGNDQSRRLLGASFNDIFTSLRITQMALPPLIGMLTFETLVYLGIRQCRYANTPASASQQEAPFARAAGEGA